MNEKLLENWLDSSSERSYQRVFVQLLAAQSFRVLHSTRHSALEYGKDIFAVAPDGVGCAYQLKANPGGRLGLNQFRTEVQPQLIQLISQPVVYPGFPPGIHRSYLVTNGYFDEEVQIAVQQLNLGPYPSKIELISRGDLLRWLHEYAASVWPETLIDERKLLELYLANPRDQLPITLLADVVYLALKIEPTDSVFQSASALTRAVASTAVLVGIGTSAFAEAENYQAVALAWAFFCVSVLATAEKYSAHVRDGVWRTLELAEEAVYSALHLLFQEVLTRRHLVEGETLAEPEIYHWRITVLIGLLTSLAFADESQDLLTEETRSKLDTWLKKPPDSVDLWGESAVAYLVPWLLWMRKYDPTLRSEYELANLADAVIGLNQKDSKSPLAAPYYGFRDVAKHRFGLLKVGEIDPFERETFVGSSFTAVVMMHLLARANLKTKCRWLWPSFTRLAHRSFSPDENWHYCLFRAPGGVDETRVYPSTYEWSQLRQDALDRANTGVPQSLSGRAWLLVLWWQIAPQRITAGAARALVDAVYPRWGT